MPSLPPGVDAETFANLQILARIANNDEALCSDLTPNLIEWMRKNTHRVPHKVGVAIIDHMSDCSLCRGRVKAMDGNNKAIWNKPKNPDMELWPIDMRNI